MKASVLPRLALSSLLTVLFIVTSGIAQTLPPGSPGGIPGGTDKSSFPDIDPEQIRESKIRSLEIWQYEAARGKIPGEIIESNGFNITSATFDEKGRTLQQVAYNQDGSILQQSNYVYDSKGYITELVSTSSVEGAGQKMTYEYAEFDTITVPVGAVAYQPDGSVQLTMKYHFNEELQIDEVLAFSPDNTIDVKQFFYYDEDGRIIEAVVRNGTDEVVSQIVYSYEKDATEIIGYGPDKVAHVKTINIFNPDSTLAEVVNYNADGKVTSRTTNTYDTDGRVIETATSLPTVDMKTRTVYTYDERGTLTEQIQYNKLDEPVKVLRYSYEYFE